MLYPWRWNMITEARDKKSPIMPPTYRQGKPILTAQLLQILKRGSFCRVNVSICFINSQQKANQV